MKHRLIGGLVVLVAIQSCSDQQTSQIAQPPVKVAMAAVEESTAIYHDEYPAAVVPLQQVDLRPQVTGFITAVHIRDGQRVKKGQLLYEIDAQLYGANYEQAVANLSVQEANLEKARRDAERYRELAKHDAVAQQLVDNAEAALKVAEKQAQAAKANITGVQTSVRYTKIFSPFDGLIDISAVKIGTAVTAGQTLLNTVSTDEQMAVDFNLSQKDIFRFSELQKQKEKEKDSTFTIAFGSEVYPHEGKLLFIDRAVDPQTGTIKVRLVFPNPDKQLRAGMNTTVRVKNNTIEHSLMIPHKALIEQLGEYFVYVPGDSNRVSQKRIFPGRAIGSRIIVLDGLDKGDSVVTEGLQNLREGSPYQTVSSSAQSQKMNN